MSEVLSSALECARLSMPPDSDGWVWSVSALPDNPVTPEQVVVESRWRGATPHGTQEYLGTVAITTAELETLEVARRDDFVRSRVRLMERDAREGFDRWAAEGYPPYAWAQSDDRD